VVTSEVQTPLGDDTPEQLVDRLKRIRGRVDGVSVTDVDLEGVVGDSIHACELLQPTASMPSIRPPPGTRTAFSSRRT
jgi:hypothetical protein